MPSPYPSPAPGSARPVLVTGGAGYIGSHIVLDLIEHGCRPVVIDNLSTGDRNLVPQGIPLIVADVADREAVGRTIAAHGIADVIHCAGSLRVEESMVDPIKYWTNNVVASVALVEACVAARVERFIYSSTAAVYGETERQPVSESVAPQPVSPYGTTKYAVEVLLRDTCAATGMTGVALRYFNVAGADPGGRAGASPNARPSLIRVVCQALIGRSQGIEVLGTDFATKDGSAVRDYIHVSDLARAHAVVLDALSNGGGGGFSVLNCGYGHGATVREVVAAGMRVAGKPLLVRDAPRRPGDIGVMVADATKLRSEYDWQPEFDDLDRIVADSLRWESRLTTNA
jgi:UDP-glucose 4-epimerase